MHTIPYLSKTNITYYIIITPIKQTLIESKVISIIVFEILQVHKQTSAYKLTDRQLTVIEVSMIRQSDMFAKEG